MENLAQVPFSVDFPRVVKSTLSPVLILGGPATGSPDRLLDEVSQAMSAGQNVRGALVGRNVRTRATPTPPPSPAQSARSSTPSLVILSQAKHLPSPSVIPGERLRPPTPSDRALPSQCCPSEALAL